MVKFDKKSPPVVVNQVKIGNNINYRVEQQFKVKDFEFTMKHSCVVKENGSVSVTDYDQTDFTPLNKDIEQQLIEKFDVSDAFELYELASIEATDEAMKAI